MIETIALETVLTIPEKIALGTVYAMTVVSTIMILITIFGFITESPEKA